MPNVVRIQALGSRVLAVATVGAVGDWSAYIDAVPGKHHRQEAEKVADEGDKLPEAIATILFPSVAKEYKWRE